MSDFRIMDVNQFFDDTQTVPASSTDGSFPLANLLDFIRTKVWRSTGNFVITATNNRIDFDEGGGELNATLTTGTFTPTTLAAEIKTQLEATGAETYTITFSASTGKWTIAVGSGTVDLLWLTGTNTAISVGTTIGFDVSADDTGLATYTSDNIAIHTEEFIKIDLGSTPTDVDSFAMVFDKTTGSLFSTSAVLTLQANATDNFSSPTVSEVLSFDTTYETFTRFFASAQTFRFWRLKMVDPTNTNLFLEVSKLILSDATELSQEPTIGWIMKVRDQSRIRETAYGHRYSDVYPNRRAFSFSYTALTSTDVETLFKIYNVVGRTTPIAIVLDSQAVNFDKDRFFLYGYMDGDFQHKNNFFTFFDSGLDIIEAM